MMEDSALFHVGFLQREVPVLTIYVLWVYTVHDFISAVMNPFKALSHSSPKF